MVTQQANIKQFAVWCSEAVIGNLHLKQSAGFSEDLCRNTFKKPLSGCEENSMEALFSNKQTNKQIWNIRHISTKEKKKEKETRGHRCNHWEIFMHA